LTARSVYEATLKTAPATRIATLETAATTLQEAINAAGVNAGKNPANGVSLADAATIKTAAQTYQATQATAVMTEQSTIAVAKNTLRSTGDFPTGQA
jgi:hypothetical protein